MKRVFISVGDGSGDVHAASLIRELNTLHPDKMMFHGLGGSKMEGEGCDILFPLANFSVTGITEVFKHIASFFKAFKTATRFIKKNSIDLIILIDAPGFNLRLAKYAKKRGIKVLYYISPQLWAWKANRLKAIQRDVDTMAVIFPFEKTLYHHADVKAYFVGHPLSYLKDKVFENSFIKEHSLEKKRVIALLPGSRSQEVEALFPTMLTAAKRIHQFYPDISFVLPLARTISLDSIKPQLQKYQHLPLVVTQQQNTHEVVKNAILTLVASGTASLETMLLGTPMIIVYRCSRLTYAIGKRLVKVKYLGLPNLLANKMIVPELIQDDFNVKALTATAKKFLSDNSYYHQCKDDLEMLGKTLAKNSADCRLSLLVADMLSLTNKKVSFTTNSDENRHVCA